MSLHIPPALDDLLFAITGERMLDADEDMAHANGRPYERLGRRVRALSDLIELSATGVGASLPPQVGEDYVRATRLFLDNGGGNYLKDFADQLDDVAKARTRSSMDIMEAKWQIIAELIRLLIELIVIMSLSVFTAGGGAAQATVAKVRSRVAILALLEWLTTRTHVLPSFTEVIEEAFTTFAVRLAMILGAPKGRRPDGFDWSQILQNGVVGGFTGLFHGLLSDLTKGLRRNFKNLSVDQSSFKLPSGIENKVRDKLPETSLNNAARPKPTPTSVPPHAPTWGGRLTREFGQDLEHAVTEGGAEALGGLAAALIFHMPLSGWPSLLGSGLSAISERRLSQGAAAFGNKFTFRPPPVVNTFGATADVAHRTERGGASDSAPVVPVAVGGPPVSGGERPTNAQDSDGFSRARATAVPEERSHSWVDPVSRPIGPDGAPTQYVVRSGFEVRRFTYQGLPVTDLTIDYRMTADPGLSSEAEGVRRRLVQGVEQVFNTPGHHLPDGSLLHVTVEPAAPGRAAHLDVSLTHSGVGTPATHHSWPTGISAQDLAHEIGHQLGLRDESGFDPSAPHRAGTASLMGGGQEAIAETSFSPGLAASGAPYEVGGLRPRHLALIGALAGSPTEGDSSPIAVGKPGVRSSPPPGTLGADPPAPIVPTVQTESAGGPVAPVRTVSEPDRSVVSPALTEAALLSRPSAAVLEATFAAPAAPGPTASASDLTTAPTPSGSGTGPVGHSSSYLSGYGQRPDGQVGLVYLEPFSPDVVDGLHRHVITALGRPTPRDDDPVLAQLRDVLSAELMAVNLPYLRSLGGHRITLDVGGSQRVVDVRLTLHSAKPSLRQGRLDDSDPDKHVERRGQGTRETVSAQPSGTYSSLWVPWTGSIPHPAAGPLRAIDLALSARLTHNQSAGSTTVTQVVQTTTAQRSNEPSHAYDFSGTWEVRIDAPSAQRASPHTPPRREPELRGKSTGAWRPSEHGPVTVWFPQHLVDAYVGLGPQAPAPADLDDLPLFGVDSVLHPRRLYEGVVQHFDADLDAAAAAQIADFLSEPVLRGTLPMQRDGGLHSSVISLADGRAVGMLRLEAQATPHTPVAKSVDGKINLESHLVNTVKNDQNTVFSSGVLLRVSAGPTFTSDLGAGHHGASLALGGGFAGTASVGATAQHAFGTSVVAGTMHAVRTNRSHLLTETDVSYTVTLIRPDGSTDIYAPGTWRHGLDLRVLNAEDARGREPTEEETRRLPQELEALEAIGQSCAPLGVDGAEVLFDQAEAWLRDHGFLPPPSSAPRRGRLADDTLVRAQLNNLSRLRDLRSKTGLRAATDSLVDGGHSLYLEVPAVTGPRRVMLRLGARRDPAKPAVHERVLPGIQVMGLAQGATGAGGQLGNTYRAAGGLSGTLRLPMPAESWGLTGVGNYRRIGQATLASTTATTIGHDQFFIGTGQDTHAFSVPVRLTLDLYQGAASHPLVDFGEPAPASRRPHDLEAGPGTGPVGVAGFVRLAVPHERTLAAATAVPVGEAYTVRDATDRDKARIAMTERDVVRIPDDALIEVVRGSAALQDAFLRIVTGSESAGQAVPSRRPGPVPGVFGRLTHAVNTSLLGDAPGNVTSVAAESRVAALSPGSLVARGHQIFGGTYVVEGLTLPGVGADGQVVIEIQAVAHTPRLTHSVNQYLETGTTTADTAQQLKGLSKRHQFGVAGTATRYRSADSRQGVPSTLPPVDAGTRQPTRINPSALYRYDRKTDKTDAITSGTATNRVPTEAGRQHRITADVTYLITVRSGHRNVISNSLGLGTSPSRTLAVDVPRGLQFLMSEGQLRRDHRWLDAIGGLPAPSLRSDATTAPPPRRYIRDGTLGLASVTSVTELRDLGTEPATKHDERRGRFHDEVTRLVERFAPGVTTPGHASYLSGVATLIADQTGTTAKRALIGRGNKESRFTFRHHRFGGATLVEVTLSARARSTAADRARLRGTVVPGHKSGMEQWASHTASGRTVSGAVGGQHRLTLNPLARFTRPDADDRTDRAGPSLHLTSASRRTDKRGRAAEDRFWLRTDNAADFDKVPYEFIVTVRTAMVADWPPNVVGALVQRGFITWDDSDVSLRTWLKRTLRGGQEGQARVPVEASLRFTGSEASGSPADDRVALLPSVSAVDPRDLSSGGRPTLSQDEVFHHSGNTPVYGFDAWDQLYTALDQVAPAAGGGWRAQPSSGSDENASVRLGELLQAGTFSLDAPRQVGGMLPSMPGAFPLADPPDQPATLTVSLYGPRVVSEGGDVAMDRLRISSDSSGTAAGRDSNAGLSLPFALSSHAANLNLLGAVAPVLRRPTDPNGFGNGVSGGRRDWLKTGSTSLPAEGRGTRSYEVRVDTHIVVSGPAGVRHVTGSAVLRIEERDALGHGITAPRPRPRVYDFPALLKSAAQAAPDSWASTPIGDVPKALADGVDTDDDGFQFWLATGSDTDPSRLALGLYGASRTARLKNRPVELVTRGPQGLHIHFFDSTGQLRLPPTSDAGRVTPHPWADFEAVATNLERAQLDHDGLTADEHTLLEQQEAAADDTRRSTQALESAEAEAGRLGREATTADEVARRSEEEVSRLAAVIDELPRTLSAKRLSMAGLDNDIAELERQELRLRTRIKAAGRDATGIGTLNEELDTTKSGLSQAREISRSTAAAVEKEEIALSNARNQRREIRGRAVRERTEASAARVRADAARSARREAKERLDRARRRSEDTEAALSDVSRKLRAAAARRSAAEADVRDAARRLSTTCRLELPVSHTTLATTPPRWPRPGHSVETPPSTGNAPLPDEGPAHDRVVENRAERNDDLAGSLAKGEEDVRDSFARSLAQLLSRDAALPSWALSDRPYEALVDWARVDVATRRAPDDAPLPAPETVLDPGELERIGLFNEELRAQSTLQNGRMTVLEAELSDTALLELVLVRADFPACFSTLVALAARDTGHAIEVVGPDDRAQRFGPDNGPSITLYFDGHRFRTSPSSGVEHT
ncbi:hypothetical protein [Streptomyces tendae]|uniref:WXG100-like domain-containing protein n=1 Tax=Streptomyces tendae TaxID=1932 RepID=UPI003D73540E